MLSDPVRTDTQHVKYAKICIFSSEMKELAGEKNHFMKCYGIIEVLYWPYLGTRLYLSLIHTGKAG